MKFSFPLDGLRRHGWYAAFSQEALDEISNLMLRSIRREGRVTNDAVNSCIRVSGSVMQLNIQRILE